MDLQPENNLVGPAGIEPATLGLEIRRAYLLCRYSSVFSVPSICATVQSVTFGDVRLQAIGHDCGHDFAIQSGCTMLAMIVTEEQRRVRWAKQGRKRGALWTPKPSPQRSAVLAPVVRVQIDPGGCAADPSCVFPPWRLPKIDELKGIFDPQHDDQYTYRGQPYGGIVDGQNAVNLIKAGIELDSCCAWSAETAADENKVRSAYYYRFQPNPRDNIRNPSIYIETVALIRALCVHDP